MQITLTVPDDSFAVQPLTRAAALALSPAVAPPVITTTGYATSGDGGAATYYKAASEPAHYGKFSITLADAVTVVWYEIQQPEVRPEMFGPTNRTATDSTSATNNTTAIQRAIDYFAPLPATGYTPQGMNGGGVFISTFAINGTINNPSGVKLFGSGFGSSYTMSSNAASFLKWVGSAGASMVRINTWWGACVDGIRFIGNSAAKPFCAIEIADAINTLGRRTTNNMHALSRVWIGNAGGLDGDVTRQFTHGIWFSGTINSDMHSIRDLAVYGCDEEAVFVENPNASGIEISTGRIYDCKGIVRTSALVTLNSVFSHTFGHAYVLDQAGKVITNAWTSEGSAGLLLVQGNGTYFEVGAGSWMQLGTGVFSDGRILDTGASIDWHIDLRLMNFVNNGSTGPVKLRVYNTSGGITQGVFAYGGRGIFNANMEWGSVIGHNDRRTIIWEPQGGNFQDGMPSQKVLLDYTRSEDRTFQSWRNDFAGKLNNYGGPFNVRQLATPVSAGATALLGTGTAGYSYRVSALTYSGETLACAGIIVFNSATLSAGAATNKVQWLPVLGAYAYKIYGRTAGSELLLATVTWDSLHGIGGTILENSGVPSWVDDGSVAPAGALPTKNSTGSADVDGPLNLNNNGFANPIKMGTSYLWMTTTGKLFVKATAPASDLDGAEVGSGGVPATKAQAWAGADTAAPITSDTLAKALYGVRGGLLLVGGGTHAYTSGCVSWSSSFAVSGAGKGTGNPTGATYSNIVIPAVGATVTVQGGTNVTVGVNGIPLGVMQTLYYSPNGTTTFTIVDYASGSIDFTAPPAWVPICQQHFNPSSYVKFMTGIVLAPNQTSALADGQASTLVKSATLANLGAPSLGRIGIATNARKLGEASGSGTGIPVWADAGNWRTYYDNTIALI